MKIKCSRCKQPKEISDFYKQTERPLGINGYCKTCRKEVDKEKYLRKKEGTIKAF